MTGFFFGILLPNTEKELMNYNNDVFWRIIFLFPCLLHIIRILLITVWYVQESPSYNFYDYNKEKYIEYIMYIYKAEY